MVSRVGGTVCQAFQTVMFVAEGTCCELGLAVARVEVPLHAFYLRGFKWSNLNSGSLMVEKII